MYLKRCGCYVVFRKDLSSCGSQTDFYEKLLGQSATEQYSVIIHDKNEICGNPNFLTILKQVPITRDYWVFVRLHNVCKRTLRSTVPDCV